MSLEDGVNMGVKVAFMALVAYQIGMHTPGAWTHVSTLPWHVIAAASVTVAALYGAFHKVVASVASTVVWVATTLLVTALVVGAVVLFGIIQFGTAEKSERAFNAVASVGNAIFALVFKQ